MSETPFQMEGTNDTCQNSPSCWDDIEAHRISNDPSFEGEDLFG